MPLLYIQQHEMEVEKNWSELFMSMTEDDNGRVRASDEMELRKMRVEEFFIKLAVFQERLKKRLEALSKNKNDQG